MQDAIQVIVRKKKVPLTSKFINDLFNLPDVEEDEYYPMVNNINWEFLQQVLDVETNSGSQWIIRKFRSHSCRREYLKPVAKEIHDCAEKKTGSACFPSLITSLYLRAYVETQANLKGQYVQGCITNHDLERFVEKVLELNQGEQEESNEPDTKESTNETEIETEANSITDIEEEEFDKELNSLKPVEGSATPEPKVESKEETVKLSVEPKFTTPMPTSSSTLKKLELSIMIDMWKFIHNQQQTYWKYAKIRDDSIRNTFQNISNTFVPRFPYPIFETWTEDTDYASRDRAEKDKGNESKK
ncbi:hypothetical protein J1N35_018898 [Gossypium stocksii]|uniref:Uncharacterized protein n=1 Tax=Gossypium stocksii TaxID=47602 RepID=A0A9D3VPX1_9ROSI|nr:hypothetical protein J1N35_018898 [Gossypium stocksii]